LKNKKSLLILLLFSSFVFAESVECELSNGVVIKSGVRSITKERMKLLHLKILDLVEEEMSIEGPLQTSLQKTGYLICEFSDGREIRYRNDFMTKERVEQFHQRVSGLLQGVAVE